MTTIILQHEGKHLISGNVYRAEKRINYNEIQTMYMPLEAFINQEVRKLQAEVCEEINKED